MCSRRGDDSNPSPNAALKSPRLLNEDPFNFFMLLSQMSQYPRSLLRREFIYHEIDKSFLPYIAELFSATMSFANRTQKTKAENLPSSQPKSSRRKQAPPADQDCGFTRRLRVMIGSASWCVIGLTASWLPRKF